MTMADSTHNANALLTAEVRELLQLLARSDITELQIEHNGSKVHIKRATGMAAVPQAVPATAPQGVAPPAPSEQVTEAVAGQTINAPMVGTFYISPAPNEPPFVQEGEEVYPGTVVGIIEAMKMMNEIESEVGGLVVRVLVQNGQPVEYGQPLFVVQPPE